jgi:hypothetical protein
MRSRASALLFASVVTALAGLRCGGGSPAGPAEGTAAPTAATPGDASAAAAARRLQKQRWIVEDDCDDRRGIRVRLHDFTDRVTRFPRGYWTIRSGGSINRVIECERGHQICLGAVQDPPPGLEWGVGLRGDRFPCPGPGKCCFRCDAFAHLLKLSCEARTRRLLPGIEAIEEALPAEPE